MDCMKKDERKVKSPLPKMTHTRIQGRYWTSCSRVMLKAFMTNIVNCALSDTSDGDIM
jgi:hypothetical protein